MRFLVITYAEHKLDNNNIYSYGPYVKEMNLWLKHVDEFVLVAPFKNTNVSNIDSCYDFNATKIYSIPSLHFKSLKRFLFSLLSLPRIIWVLFSAMKTSDHIHLRCPGNVGLIASIIQIFFSSKMKTVKYAGNWDPKAQQPLSYKLQKWILSNTFLTKNTKVLVYGEWPNQSKNIVPFYTATYNEAEKVPVKKRDLDEVIQFVFIGTLSTGKRPEYAIEIVNKLIKEGVKCKLDFYGEGTKRSMLQNLISNYGLADLVTIHGNVDTETIKAALKQAHFVVLPSKSEGWPKAIAEGMFWGAIPIATRVSCLEYMLDNGNRGILLNLNLKIDTQLIKKLVAQPEAFHLMAVAAAQWSRQFTLDRFENDIKQLLQN